MRLVFHSQTTVCRLSLVVLYSCARMNTLVDTLKPQSDVLLYRSTVTGALAVDGWAVTFGTARRGLGGLWPSRCIRCNSHQRPVHQIHAIRCGTILHFALQTVERSPYQRSWAQNLDIFYRLFGRNVLGRTINNWILYSTPVCCAHEIFDMGVFCSLLRCVTVRS